MEEKLSVYIPRLLEKKIEKYLPKREILAVVGPRQSGKTTMLKHIFKRLKRGLFIDFGEREKLTLFDNDLKSFIDLYVKGNDYLFIDEFQYSKDGGKNLKYIFDNFSIKIVISGSSVSELSIQSIKYLVGRIFIFTLYPLSFSEFLRYKDIKLYNIYQNNQIFSVEIISKLNELYKEFIIYGGYPRVVTTDSIEEKQIVLKNIYNTYILKEIKEILGLRDDYKLSKFIHALALQLGSMANYSELCGLINCSYKELLSDLTILKKTFVISESRPFYANKRTELVKNPKFFFIDNGFRNVIINNFLNVKNRTDKGQLNENFVSSEIIKKDMDLRYWRTKSKAEIDFIIEQQGKVVPIEVKSDLQKPVLSRAIYSFVEKYSVREVFVLSENLDIKKRFDHRLANFKPLFSVGKIIEKA